MDICNINWELMASLLVAFGTLSLAIITYQSNCLTRESNIELKKLGRSNLTVKLELTNPYEVNHPGGTAKVEYDCNLLASNHGNNPAKITKLEMRTYAAIKEQEPKYQSAELYIDFLSGGQEGAYISSIPNLDLKNEFIYIDYFMEFQDEITKETYNIKEIKRFQIVKAKRVEGKDKIICDRINPHINFWGESKKH